MLKPVTLQSSYSQEKHGIPTIGKKDCTCDSHTENKSKLHDIIAQKCSQCLLDELIRKGIFTSKRRHICQECL